MARYIDVEKLTEKIKQCSAFKNLKSYWFENNLLQNVVLDLIDNQPTAEVVEVVFCEKCKHWRKMGRDPLLEKDFGHCHNNGFPFMCETCPDTNADDFCSYGERRDT